MTTSSPRSVYFLSLSSTLLLLLATGCGSADDSNARLTGAVTLDNQPLKNGSITFLPIDGKSATAGTTIENGEFMLVIPPGKKKVEIVGTKVVGQRRAYEGDANSPMVDITEDIVPTRYNVQSDITVDVTSGENHEVFALTSN
ncbi:hypothetical protein M4951_18025 [Blastopirellula sp. J2-11]|uniref:hypothetical protein n=1 Tax=Blastopirellula sp. J2-11 TaxID=2943192 RepID=UPI0021C9CF1B|nr:hypothetical protein [Blastopirellula sp. J2-11]UUO05267.1 hypothetical protein M4951_18025 [Blastopirellula sp. J2-11]